MQLRKATLADLDKIYPIYMDKTVNPYMSFPIMSKEEFQSLFQTLLGELVLHEKNNEILALVVATKLPYRSSHVAYISKLAIHPHFQNQGLGSQLFAQLITDLKQKNITRLELKVESDNQNAIRFYKKLGFQIEGTLRGYFNREGEIVDEHFMGLLLDEFSQ
jgi:ribosomal protein S18 acetylase RimI-like enzyme